MTKRQVVKGMITAQKQYAEKYGLTIGETKYGHHYDGGPWQGIAEEDDVVPDIFADNGIAFGDEGHISFEVDHFWNQPRICFRNLHAMTVIIFGETPEKTYEVNEVRVDGFNYKELYEEALQLIETIKTEGVN